MQKVIPAMILSQLFKAKGDTMENMYAAPNANLDEPLSSEATYVPRFFSFSGRIGRMRYLAYQVFMVLCSYLFLFGAASLILSSSSASFSDFFGSTLGVIVVALFLMVLFVGTITFVRRRLHDLGQSGWLTLIIFVPYLNSLFSLYLIFAGGDKDSNRYGPAPSANTTAVIVGALLVPALAIIGIIAAIAIPAYKG
ncbi:DUF805 domain-containing protein [Undibacterium cyanobacteriorum]|uniref:DUF805 domain-containing protein n=1 Tax=Undibacterium cyanobacteriorum TaxID=3073561 RepID=A0ABY9RKS0_9BURK|nr:DUF805 domain-containing protein [Undibacterium sp. 20NA77.5]WMW80952.1 DUF805 domain-containing protein [Undibacterium sp. 20NA77.5]